ncbi:Pyruvate kinase [Helicobacter sp. NHP21005]|uniref:pyruvate kinase n=1 Tax=Helicobacter felistomachi TaxID=3040201 RepID=UPI0025737F98|nr:pyruvate kinase [Helicobacter sp. NHP21005]BEG57504.1 Pyruvate kinase [Helicobacter sp. NHP21005]
MVVDVSDIPFQEFWHMQLSQQHMQEAWSVLDVRQILEKYSFIGLADWEEKKGQIRDFLEVMRVNDIVAIKHGQQLVALTQVIGGAYDIRKDRALFITEKENPLVDWMHYRRPVRILAWASEGQTIPQGRGTLNKCISPGAETSQIILKWYEKVQEALRAKGEGIMLV